MLKHEFETLVGCEVPPALYVFIEIDYMESEETKQEYTARIFGARCASKVDVLDCFAAMLCADNRRALRGNPSATEMKLREMDKAIFYHHAWTIVD